MAAEWLADFYFGQVLEARRQREQDPGLPAYPWHVDGRPSELGIPLSFVAAIRDRRYPNLINLDQLRRSVLEALAGKPDTRTQQQRSRDAWAEYVRAKEKYEPQVTATRRQEEEGPEAQDPEAQPEGPDGQAGPGGEAPPR